MGKNCSLEAQGSKKMVWVILLVTLIFGIFQVGNVNALTYNQTTFNNSLSSENVTLQLNSTITNLLCYQEYVNQSNSTGICADILRFGGNYIDVTSNWTDLGNLFDGNYNTYAVPNFSNPLALGDYRYVNITYQKPKINATSVIWQGRFEVPLGGGLVNYTLPASCINAFPDNITLRAGARLYNDGNARSNIALDCWNGASFTNLATYTRVGLPYAAVLYEEGIFWNFTNYQETRYLPVPEDTFLSSGTLTLTGFTFTNEFQQFAGVGCTGNVSSCDAAYDGNWGTSVNLRTNYPAIVYINLTNIYNTNVSVKALLNKAHNPFNCIAGEFLNSTGSWVTFFYECSDGLHNLTAAIPNSASMSIIQTRYFTNNPFTTGNCNLFETTLVYNYPVINPIFPNLKINNEIVWYGNSTNFSLESTNDLFSYINEYLDSCTYSGGFCNVPFLFGSFTPSKLQYSNMSFLNTGIIENSQTYNASTYETESQTYSINVTYNEDNFPFSSGKLFYNGTQYTASKQTSTNGAIFTATIDVPLVSSVGENENKSFYWQISITDELGQTYVDTSTTQMQNVSRIHFEECSGIINTTTVNFKAYEEINITQINPFLFQGTFSSWFGSGTVKRSIPTDNLTVSSLDLCISPSNKTYNVDAVIYYDSATPGTYVPRDYNFNQQTFVNVSQNISLYLLPFGSSTSFILYVRDQTLQPVSNAIVEVQRYYPGEDVYRTVQSGRTGDNGKTVGFFVTETVDYRFRVVYNGSEVLLTNKQKIVGESAPFTITLTIGEGSANPLLAFEGVDDLTASLTYDNNTDTVYYTYEDTSGNFTYARLYVEKQNYNSQNTVICDVNSTSAASVLTCNVSAYEEGTFFAQAYISRSPEILEDSIKFIKDLAKDIFGTTGLFLAWFLILTVAMTMIWNPTVGIIGVNATVILVNLIGIASFPPLAIFALIALSITIIILMET